MWGCELREFSLFILVYKKKKIYEVIEILDI